jgi:hypothetical protein
VVPYAHTIIACGLHDFRILDQYGKLIVTMADSSPFTIPSFYVPVVMSCRLVILAEEGHYARVIELLRGMHESIFRDNRPHPMGWLDNWPLIERIRAQAETALGADGYQAAWERGAHLSLDEMHAEIAPLLKRIT